MPPAAMEEIKNLWATMYGPHIDKFLETRWFATRGIAHLQADHHLCEQYLTLLSRFGITFTTNYTENAINQSLEAHVIWASMNLCRTVATNVEFAAHEANEGLQEARKRMDVLEALITNQSLETNPLSASPPSISSSASGPGTTSATTARTNPLEEQLRSREHAFWYNLGQFLTLHNDATNTDATHLARIDDVLATIRQVLDSKENRDVLYSVMIARHVGQRVADGRVVAGALDSAVVDERDPRTMLNVAREFLRGEAGGRGTTQVVQRICGMAVKSWSR